MSQPSLLPQTTPPLGGVASQRADRKLVQRVLLDLIIVTVTLIPIAICEFAVEPYKRGIFCDDESISYPFRPNTVTNVMLGLLVGLLPTSIFFLVEFVRWRGPRKLLCGRQIPAWLLELGRQFMYFVFGLALTFNATELAKYGIGRLRPHFLAVCQPQLLDGSTCRDAVNQRRYIENYICLGTGFSMDEIRETRLSFPSAHASLSFYAMVYCALYIHERLTWRGSKLLRYIVAFVLLMLAWFSALSRVMDHWHHWSDVLVGGLIGLIGALLTANNITKLFRRTPTIGNLKLSIPRQDTSTSLQNAVVATPPPYTANSMNNGHYCTKV